MLQLPTTSVQPSNRRLQPSVIRNHTGIRSIAVKMLFIISIFDSVQPFYVVVTASVIPGIFA